MAEPTRWWRVFGLRRGAGRQRQSRRFVHRARVAARCDSWPEFLELVTGDVSAGGMFVATDHDAAVGEAVELRLELPDGSELELRGRVAVGAGSGLGIELEPLEGADAARFEEVLAIARAAEPRPEPPVEPEPGSPPLFAAPEGAEPMRLSSVHAAIGADRIQSIDPDEITGEHALDDIEIAVWEPPIEPGAPPSIAPRATVDGGGVILGIDLGHSRLAAATAAGDRVRPVALGDGELSLPAAGDPPRRALERVRRAAEARLELPIERAVLAVPLRHDDDAIEQLRAAGRDAGLEIVAVIDEPSAAVAANRFGLERQASPRGAASRRRGRTEMLLGVYDFGGGGFDFTVVDASAGDVEILATAGSRELGGDQLDVILAESAAHQLMRARRVDVRQQEAEWRALLAACEGAKRELSTAEIAAVVVDDVFRDAAGPVDLRVTISAALFEQACGHLIDRSVELCAETLERLGRGPGELAAIVLSGGGCRIPAVRRRLAAAFEVPLCSAVPPEYAVCLGAGIHAARLSRRASLRGSS